MSEIQSILDRHAAATPGPKYVEVIDDHSGLPGSKSWLICDAVRTQWGNDHIEIDEDESTARFVASAFTDVPRMAAALQRVEAVLEGMEFLIDCGTPGPSEYANVAALLREILTLEPDR